MGVVAVGGEAEAAAPAILWLYATIACQDRMGSRGVRGAGAGARRGYTPCTRIINWSTITHSISETTTAVDMVGLVRLARWYLLRTLGVQRRTGAALALRKLQALCRDLGAESQGV
jgi:hypothetical protein